MKTSICIAPSKPEIAFRELLETWVSPRGAWKIVAKVECVESVPKYKARTVRIFHRTKADRAYYLAELNTDLVIPPYVLDHYHYYLKLVKEF